MRFIDLACMTQDEVKAAALSIEGAALLHSVGGDSVYVEGGLPLVLVAHCDTVYGRAPLASELHECGGMLSTAAGSAVGVGGDDRCGCWVLFEVAQWDYDVRPSLLFCMDEETCAGSSVGLDVFDWSDKKAFIEIDGPGFGVFYADSCSTSELNAYMEKIIGLHKLPSSYNDIHEICTTGSPAGCTLGAAYYNQHSYGSERVSLFGLGVVLDTVREICKHIDLLGWSVVQERKTAAALPAASGSTCQVGRGWDKYSYWDYDDWGSNDFGVDACVCPEDCEGCACVDKCGIYADWRKSLENGGDPDGDI